MADCVITCGVYGFTEDAFIEAIRTAKPDVFVDVRHRRGVRGHNYAFANSKRLQTMLNNYDIPYVHKKDLAPAEATIRHEAEEDKGHGLARHDRDHLSKEFVAAYKKQVLDTFDARAFIDSLGPDVQRPLLFCVERTPEACHRGLLADEIVRQLKWERNDLVP